MQSERALTIGEESQSVSGVAGDTTLDRLDPFPLAFRRADLQARDVLGEEQGQTAKVGVSALGVRLGTIPLVLRADVVDHVPEVVVGLLVIIVGVGQVILGQFEDDGNQHKQFADHLLPQVAVERGDLVVVLLHDVVLADIVIGWDCLWDVELWKMVSLGWTGQVERRQTISMFSLTPVSPTQREFSR